MVAPPSHVPRIGVPYRTKNEQVTTKTDKIEKYLTAIRQAGAEPVPVSLELSASELGQLAESLDGFVLSGSPADVDPAHFGAPRQPECAAADLDRERTDFALLKHAFAEHKPVLAICYGIQSLNVHLGGTLLQDIPKVLGTEIDHDWDDEQAAPDTLHDAQFETGSQLAELNGSTRAVINSSHHQSIQEPGRGLRVTARAADGVIEAVEWTGDSNWVVGVQWHPERLADKDALSQSLFRGLVAAAAARKAVART
ncbi:MAG TPA: gamma-glutamyl-gamma-aminobutyrate hydrolase family protein [Candidatus Acidoferrales bacterium]|nr:gamma-glutamyl-gamma-aminobutyrate hydrolase family protein [Candidatus Acidoferrales bacterium]